MSHRARRAAHRAIRAALGETLAARGETLRTAHRETPQKLRLAVDKKQAPRQEQQTVRAGAGAGAPVEQTKQQRRDDLSKTARAHLLLPASQIRGKENKPILAQQSHVPARTPRVFASNVANLLAPAVPKGLRLKQIRHKAAAKIIPTKTTAIATIGHRAMLAKTTTPGKT